MSPDRATLLALRRAVQAEEPCVYLEVGSESGNSLLPALLDPRCTEIHSVDLRPEHTPDERGRTFEYGVSTADMLRNLSANATPDQLAKLKTYDMNAATFVAKYDVHPNFVFLDAEH